MNAPGNLMRVVRGEEVGTLVLFDEAQATA
jgi:hypothetical protein